MPKLSENSHVIASRGWGFHNLKTVMLCIDYVVYWDILLRWDYQELLYIIWFIWIFPYDGTINGYCVYYVVSLDIPLIWACHIFVYGLK